MNVASHQDLKCNPTHNNTKCRVMLFLLPLTKRNINLHVLMQHLQDHDVNSALKYHKGSLYIC